MTVVGVTGHRVLAEPEQIRAGVTTALQRFEQIFPGQRLSVVSALAEGADRIVATEVLARPDGQLTAVLPLDTADYLTDFKSAESRTAFWNLIGRASEVIELPLSASRQAAYEAAGVYVLDHCDVLIAIWDGQEAQGKGGTGAIVARARQRQLPIAWIKAANRKPGTMQAASPGPENGAVVFENL
jgi:hypothetical protein